MKNEFVTKADLKETSDGLHRRIDSVEAGLHQEIDSVKNELRGEIKSVKDELKNDFGCLAVQVFQISNDLKEFKQETRSHFNTVITSIDGLTGLITNVQTEVSVIHHAMLRHENRLDNHEARIVVLEQRKDPDQTVLQ